MVQTFSPGPEPDLDLDISYLIFRANSNDGLFSLIGIVEDNGTANLTQSSKDINGTSYNLFAAESLTATATSAR